MPLVQVVLIIVAIGVVMWLVNSKIPMASPYKEIANAVVIIAVVLWLLSLYGLLDGLNAVRVGRPR